MGSQYIDSYENVIHTIEKQGFENIQITLENRYIKIAYENRIFRSEISAMGSILTTVLNSDIADSVSLTALNRNIPLTKIGVDLDNFSAYFNGRTTDNTSFSSQLSVDMLYEDWDEFEKIPVLNPSSKKVELTIKPGIETKFHTSSGFALWKLNLIPELSFSFAKGTQCIIEGILPIFYEFDEDIKEIKLGDMYVNQTQRWTNSLWTSISGGIFHWKSNSWDSFDRFKGCKDGQKCYEFYRYGISAETDKFWENGQVNLKLKIDYTGHLDYHDGTWGYSDPNQFTWLSSLGYRFRHPNVYLSIGMGKNLYEKTPFGINIIRSFNEIDVGLHGRWYDLEYLSDFAGGITISVPIPFFQYWNNGLIVRSSKQFTWGLWYHDHPGSGYPKSGTSVENFYKKLFPTYIKNNTDQITN